MTPDRERRYVEEIETLIEENRQLKETIHGVHPTTNISRLMVAFRLTPGEARLVYALYRASGRTLGKEFLMRALDGHEDTMVKIVDVYVCKVRAKFRKLFGDAMGQGAIVTLWGQGYSMSQDAQLRVKAALMIEEDRDTRI